MDNEAVVRVGSKAISRVVCLTSKEHKIKEITGRVSGGKEKSWSNAKASPFPTGHINNGDDL